MHVLNAGKRCLLHHTNQVDVHGIKFTGRLQAQYCANVECSRQVMGILGAIEGCANVDALAHLGVPQVWTDVRQAALHDGWACHCEGEGKVKDVVFRKDCKTQTLSLSKPVHALLITNARLLLRLMEAAARTTGWHL